MIYIILIFSKSLHTLYCWFHGIWFNFWGYYEKPQRKWPSLKCKDCLHLKWREMASRIVAFTWLITYLWNLLFLNNHKPQWSETFHSAKRKINLKVSEKTNVWITRTAPICKVRKACLRECWFGMTHFILFYCLWDQTQTQLSTIHLWQTFLSSVYYNNNTK